jgi:hypothetical protein
VRRLLTALALLALVAVPATADGKKRHHHAAGVKGVVLNSTCPGACAEAPPPEPLYAGPVTVTVARAADGVVIASQAVSDGHFRLRVKRGLYDVSSVPPNPPTCDPTPQTVCPLQASPAVVAPCLQGETKRVQVRRHRVTRLELHVSNTCIV